MKITPVVFRKFKDGEIIALFPTIPATLKASDCQSYMHIGQHGAADALAVLQQTTLAKPAEYKDLLTELHKIGYRNLKVCQRITYTHFQEREAELKAMDKRARK